MTTLNPRCVGTTGTTFFETTNDNDLEPANPKRRKIEYPYQSWEANYFSNAQFSNDGTTIITQNANRSLRTFIIPPDLLDGSEQPHSLKSHIALNSPTPVQSYAIYPHYALLEPSTTLVLSASNDLPISLNNVLQEDYMQAQYSLIHPTTEAYIAPCSLLWIPDGMHFLAGSANQIALFDASCPGSGPVVTRKTARGKREARAQGTGPMRGCKGVVTALSASRDGILAAGTRERNVALYQPDLGGDCITSFSVASQSDLPNAVKGTGVSQLAWSPDGTYLLVAERESDGVQVFDMRNTHQRVSWLSDRKAGTVQKLGIGGVPTADGYEVWAGGTDGCVRMWKNPGVMEGEQGPDSVIEAHNDPVSAAIWHPSGAVLATCSGQRSRRPHNADSSDESGGDEGEARPVDNSLKVWAF